MTQFMIFGNTAVNMTLVKVIQQDPDCVTLILHDSGRITAHGVSIDDILTAQAAGQARVSATQITTPELLQPLRPNQTSFSQRRSNRFREPIENDPQAMKSIGRR